MPKKKPSKPAKKKGKKRSDLDVLTQKPIKTIRKGTREEVEKASISLTKAGASEVLAKGKIVPYTKQPISLKESLRIGGLPDKVGSMGFLAFMAYPPGGNTLQITRLFIPKAPVNYRGLGIKEELLNQVLEIARQRKMKRIRISASHRNKKLLDFLFAQGFRLQSAHATGQYFEKLLS